MKGAAAALGAGTAFASGALAGLLVGWWIGRQTGASWWVAVGLVAGAVAGGYGALRLLLAASQ